MGVGASDGSIALGCGCKRVHRRSPGKFEIGWVRAVTLLLILPCPVGPKKKD